LPDRYAELFETLLFYDYDENDTQLVAQFSVHAEKLAQEPAERVTDSCIKMPDIKEIAPPRTEPVVDSRFF
jgi:hypothetical protein